MLLLIWRQRRARWPRSTSRKGPDREFTSCCGLPLIGCSMWWEQCASALVGLLLNDLNMPDVAAGCILLSFTVWLQWEPRQALTALPGRKGGRVWLNFESFFSEREREKRFVILCWRISSLQQRSAGSRAKTRKCNLNDDFAVLSTYIFDLSARKCWVELMKYILEANKRGKNVWVKKKQTRSTDG